MFRLSKKLSSDLKSKGPLRMKRPFWWRRGESNPRPEQTDQRRLHVYPKMGFRPWNNASARIPQLSQHENVDRIRAVPASDPPGCQRHIPLAEVRGATSLAIKQRGPILRWQLMFDPVINEANESSSTCGRRSICPVETGTPPYGTANIVRRRAPVKGRFRIGHEKHQKYKKDSLIGRLLWRRA